MESISQLGALGRDDGGEGGDDSGAGFVQPQPFTSSILDAGRSVEGALAYYQREVTITDRPTNPLEGFTEISRFVRVSNPTTKANEVAQAINVYYGDNTTQRILLEPGDRSEFMPLRSVDELWLRCKKGQGPADVVIEVFH